MKSLAGKQTDRQTDKQTPVKNNLLAGGECRIITILLPNVGPTGQAVACDIRGNYSTGWTVRWTPHELGVYDIEIQYGHSVVVGSPFTCKVFDLSRVIILHDQHQDPLDASDDVIFYGTSRCSSCPVYTLWGLSSSVSYFAILLFPVVF